MTKIYLCRSMTGRVKEDVVKEAALDKQWFENAGLAVLDPVAAEGVKPTKERLLSSKKAMDQYWPRDKEMIREAHVVIDMTPHMNSEGSKHEIGYARYHCWKPVIRVFPLGQLPPASSVARYEDDVVCDSREEATEWIYRVYGTPWKRLKWKLRILDRCLLGFLKVRLMWLVDWI